MKRRLQFGSVELWNKWIDRKTTIKDKANSRLHLDW